MFAFTGLKPEMVEEMINKYSIHFTLDGRINRAGLNQNNIDFNILNMLSELYIMD